MSNFDVELNGKRVSVTVTKAALRNLNKTVTPVLIEVELYFSCLIKKVCHFRETEDVGNYVRVTDGLYLNFRATMTSKCSMDQFDKDKPADFPIVNQKPYIPKWVNLDFTANEWAGDFGYAEYS